MSRTVCLVSSAVAICVKHFGHSPHNRAAATTLRFRPHTDAAASIEIDSVGLKKVVENGNFNLII